MAARFPQSGTSVAYQIKAAYAGKIHVLFWAASADSVHRLRPGDTASTIVSRAATGATFNSTDGRISGASGNALANHFSDSKTGGYQSDADDFTVGFGVWGDLFNSVAGTGSVSNIISCQYDHTFAPGFSVRVSSSELKVTHKDGGFVANVPNMADSTEALMTVAVRYVAADATAKDRMWVNGAEDTSKRATTAPAGSDLTIGDASRPLIFGYTANDGTNERIEWEFAFFADGTLTDAELATITSDPASVIEVASSPTRLAIPTSQLTLPRSALAASSSHSFRRFG